jgi:mRNA deadenylase 3'-5' endonuclease subunit Ccr4
MILKRGKVQVSAYSQFARMQGKGQVMEQQRRRIDATTSEPLFTNCTKDFLGTLDYIFYTGAFYTLNLLFGLRLNPKWDRKARTWDLERC